MLDVIVIGGGPAGVTAALRATELGASVALVERAELGGTGTYDGCAPTRVLARSARLLRDSEHFDEYGLVGRRPQVDLRALLARTHEITDRLSTKKQLAQNLAASGIDLYTGAGYARFDSEKTIALEDGRRLEADRFIICAGGRARRLSFPGSEMALTHSDIWYLDELPESIAIVGGAATGCQLGSIFQELGVNVMILERNQRLLKAEDAMVAEAMVESFRARGIDLIFNIGGVERIEAVGEQRRLVYTKAGRSEALDVEAVLLAVGWPSNADRLNLQAAGVHTDHGYIVVDQYLRTTAPHIYAAGDINGQMMLVQSASHEGRIAAENAVLGIGQRYTHHIVPHGGFTDPEYAGVGLTEEAARAVERDCMVATVPYADLDRAVIDEHTFGYCKLIVSQATHRILGAHIVGEQALEAIQLVAAGMASDMWVEHLAELELAYPTYTAIVGLAARQIVRALGVMPMATTWQALGKQPIAEWERSEV